jgi:hypothetical protein
MEDFSTACLDALIKAYEAWAKTPEGKKRNEETKERRIIPIAENELPKGWELEDGGKPEDEYAVYSNAESGIDVTIELAISAPIQFGGRQSYTVTVKEEILDDDEEEEENENFEEIERTIGDFDAEKDWKLGAQQAHDKALEYMKRISGRY